MNGGKIGQQFHALFGIFMVCFYLGIGVFMLFFIQKYFIIDKALCVIMGSTFVLYGTYRIYATYKNIVEAFFTKDQDSE